MRGNPTHWTEKFGTNDHKTYLTERLKTISVKALAREISIPSNTLFSKVYREKVDFVIKRGGNNKVKWAEKLAPYPGKDTKEKMLWLVKKYKPKEIAKKLGVSRASVYYGFVNIGAWKRKVKSCKVTPSKPSLLNYLEFLNRWKATPDGVAFLATEEGQKFGKWNERK